MITTNIPWLPSTLENELVKLELLKSDDFERLFAVAADSAIWEQHPVKDRYKREVFQLYFDSGIESKACYLVFDNTTGNLIGCTRYYNYNPEDKSIAIGYTFLATAYWGGMYNKAMKKLLFDEAFKYVDKVHLHIGKENMRSTKAALKLGLRKVRDINEDENGIKAGYIEYVVEKTNWQLG